jgi:hydroxymethylbilane synthase
VSNNAVRFGTRGSNLALTQSTSVARRVAERGNFPYELVTIRTEGDINRGSLARIGGSGVFVVALRQALLENRCDIAVHSLKDLPVGPADGLGIAAIPERADTRDALCARDGLALQQLQPGARVGTGSPRRAAQLRAARPDLDIVDIRGNVETRLGRVPGLGAPGPGDLDAVVLAAAGLQRLGREEAATELLDPSVMLPAPGQGALAVECRAADAAASAFAGALAQYDHQPTRLAVTAERAVLRRLEAGCAAPVGALAGLRDGVLALDAVVCSEDGRESIRLSAETGDRSVEGAEQLGKALGGRLLDAGAAAITDLNASK